MFVSIVEPVLSLGASTLTLRRWERDGLPLRSL